jgi:hypothetical protein
VRTDGKPLARWPRAAALLRSDHPVAAIRARAEIRGKQRGKMSRHDTNVQTQRSRDEKTVAIATALGLFVLVLAVGSAFLWATRSALHLNDHLSFILLVAASTMAAVVHLIRLGRR